MAAAAAAQAMLAVALAAILSTPAPQPDTFSNIPPTLSGARRQNAISFHFASCSVTGSLTRSCPDRSSLAGHAGGDGKAERIKHPKSAKALQCTTKCVGTCIRGGGGAPGEGPLNVRR
jgi:hypothetical protein